MNALFCHEAKCCRKAFLSRTDVTRQTSACECVIAMRMKLSATLRCPTHHSVTARPPAFLSRASLGRPITVLWLGLSSPAATASTIAFLVDRDDRGPP